MKLYRLDYLDSKSCMEQELFFIKKENAILFIMNMLKKKRFSSNNLIFTLLHEDGRIFAIKDLNDLEEFEQLFLIKVSDGKKQMGIDFSIVETND